MELRNGRWAADAAPAAPPPIVTQKRREERRQEQCDRLVDMAAAFFSVSSKELRENTRGNTEVARVRQIAMYVCHVALGQSMADIGRGFCRDRSTVVHACHLVEDMRDDHEFDAIIHRFEMIVQAAFAGVSA